MNDPAAGLGASWRRGVHNREPRPEAAREA